MSVRGRIRCVCNTQVSWVKCAECNTPPPAGGGDGSGSGGSGGNPRGGGKTGVTGGRGNLPQQVLTNKLVGKEPRASDGSRDKVEDFLTKWGVYQGLNCHSYAMDTSFNQTMLFLSDI